MTDKTRDFGDVIDWERMRADAANAAYERAAVLLETRAAALVTGKRIPTFDRLRADELRRAAMSVRGLKEIEP